MLMHAECVATVSTKYLQSPRQDAPRDPDSGALVGRGGMYSTDDPRTIATQPCKRDRNEEDEAVGEEEGLLRANQVEYEYTEQGQRERARERDLSLSHGLPSRPVMHHPPHSCPQ
jgi:hypothetical protein